MKSIKESLTFFPWPQNFGKYSVEEDVRTSNTLRVFWLALAILPVHLTIAAVFLLSSAGSGETDQTWRQGVIITHAVMAVLACIFLAAAYYVLKQKQYNSITAVILTEVAALSYIMFGAVLATVDQLVTAETTPYIVVCMSMALILLIHPAVAAVNYILGLLCFVFLLPLTQHSPELLLSVRVNGIAATAIGLGLAVVLWQSKTRSFAQQQQLARQTLELEAINERLSYVASHDTLTGLLNRTIIMELADAEVARIRRTGRSASMILLDLDHFKNINDTYGHPVGDKVLTEVAHIIRSMLRESDLAVRMGGEEFMVLLPDTPLAEGVRAAERLRSSIADYTFPAYNDSISITTSCGVAPLLGEGEDPVKISYSEADRALYRAKSNGRNRVEAADFESSENQIPCTVAPARSNSREGYSFDSISLCQI